MTNYLIESVKSALISIQVQRKKSILLIAAPHLDIGLLTELYRYRKQIDQQDELDIVLYTKGGDVNATRRIALLLHDFAGATNIIVPSHCQSSGTLLALAAKQILYTPLSLFTAIDPHLHGNGGDDSQSISTNDIRYFPNSCVDWFGIDESEAKTMLSTLADSIFAPTLTAFYRTEQETYQVAQELLSLPAYLENTQIMEISRFLINGLHSHNYYLTGEQLQRLGLNTCAAKELEEACSVFAENLPAMIGGAARENIDDTWCDALIISPDSVSQRIKTPDSIITQWTRA
ncbi:hypothetical protein OE749_13375 [Aestuariibacter sp. AA17]|uniref:Serine dehydrogenase proteinase n=1 Tax=Fluctibacter corallii TaxID=2984329 RepID=A0ABT3AAI4_9ALTE|nr:hypothetical protein [Aestuariibacter sp. AA17]MCV2885683.1 hypothetical protein [Aestuariibacter sp. AA17]